MSENDSQSQTEKDSRLKGAGVGKTIRLSESPTTLLGLAGVDENWHALAGATASPSSLGVKGLKLSSDLIGGVPSVGDTVLISSRLNAYTSGEVAQISASLAKIEQGLTEMKKAQAREQKDDRPLLDDLIKKIADTKGETDNLAARLLLPPPVLTDQQLVPATLLERLEEYRSDENLLLLFAGTFGGAILGVLGSWFVAGDGSYSRSSILFVIVLVIVTVLFGCWAYTLRQRGVALKQKMFGKPTVSNQMLSGENEGASGG